MDYLSSQLGLTISRVGCVLCLLSTAWGCEAELPQDRTAPTFPVGAVLGYEWSEPTVLTFSWPTASDNVGVALYVLNRNGLPVKTILPSSGSVSAEDHGPGLEREWSLYAIDSAGNRSVPLVVTVRGGDRAPVWTAVQVVVTRPPEDTPALPKIHLEWAKAIDDGEVVGYDVVERESGSVLVTTSTRSASISTAFGAPLSLVVVAIDDANQRAPGPVVDWVEPDRQPPNFSEGTLVAS